MKIDEIRRQYEQYRNPPRADQPCPHYSAGRNYYPQRYVVGWPSGVVKVGSTWNGKRRWGPFLNRSGIMLDLAHYERPGDDLRAETWLQIQLEKTYAKPFNTPQEATPILGNRGGGYLECFAIPPEMWPEIVELARTVDGLV